MAVAAGRMIPHRVSEKTNVNNSRCDLFAVDAIVVVFANQSVVRVLTLPWILTKLIVCRFARYKSVRCGKNKAATILF